jgi:hypothetical protein
MATQNQVNNMVKNLQVIYDDCKKDHGLDHLATNFKFLSEGCKSLEKILKAEGYTGVGLVVKLFN